LFAGKARKQAHSRTIQLFELHRLRANIKVNFESSLIYCKVIKSLTNAGKTTVNLKNIAIQNKIMECITGSHAYGMSTPTSDIDIRGLFIAEKINILTPFYQVNQCQDFPGEDKVIYEISKFMNLLVQMNPNILELLWVDEDNITFTTPYYEKLRANRYQLLSSKAKHTFTGYAHAQLKRISGHNKWINNPQPESPPKQIDYLIEIATSNKKYALKENETDYSLFKAYGGNLFLFHKQDVINAGITSPEECTTSRGELIIIDSHQYPPNKPAAMLYYDHHAYRSEKDKHSNYWSWVNNRNKNRSALEIAHGYDTKHAAHLVRLLKMGLEILTTEKVLVKRPDAEELLAIRAGSMSYDELIKYTDNLESKIEKAYKKTTLPKAVDLKFSAQLLMETYEEFWLRNEN
jgi:uncharacterized protein